MIRLSLKRKTLIAGAAGLCLAVPGALSLVPQFGSSRAHAGEPAPARNPNHVLHAAVERELSGLGIDAGPATPVIQPVAGEIQQTQGGQPQGFNQQRYQSEVQRQLQMLYQQDGRPMPNMVPTPQVSQETWQQYQQQYGEIRGRRPSRWDWLNPQNWRRQWERTFGRSNTPEVPQPPEAPEFNPEASNALNTPALNTPALNTPAEIPSDLSQLRVHPLEAAQQQQQPAQQRAAASAQTGASQPRLFPGLMEEMQGPVVQPEPVAQQPAPALILMPMTPDGELTEPVAAPPVIEPAGESPVVDRSETPVFDFRPERERLPSVESVVQEPEVQQQEPDGWPPVWEERVAQEQPQPVVQEGPRDTPAADPLLNPFPELPEQAADEQTGPYSGLELELDPFADPVSGSSSAGAPAAADENPFAPFVERHAEASVSVKPELPRFDEVGPSLQGPGLPDEPGTFPNVAPRELPAAAESSTDTGAAPHSPEVKAKMARIAARRGLTGLKGFCPVVLRDHRDLADARAEYTVIYAGTQYWFSSEEAKQAFLMAPEAYAPVKGGIDLVHFEQTGEEQEGLLDHAAWFRGRLHLFATAENKAAFIANPRTYSPEE